MWQSLRTLQTALCGQTQKECKSAQVIQGIHSWGHLGDIHNSQHTDGTRSTRLSWWTSDKRMDPTLRTAHEIDCQGA